MCGVCVVGLLAPAYVGAALLAGLLDEEAGPRGSSPLQARPPHIHACYVKRPVLGRKRHYFLKWRGKAGLEL